MSLARDYLSIMATSVSSERAFSQGGLTITKRRTRLDAGLVEALQILKCMIRQDLVHPEPAPSVQLEKALDKDFAAEEDDDPEKSSNGSDSMLSEEAKKLGDKAVKDSHEILTSLWDIVLDETENTLYEE